MRPPDDPFAGGGARSATTDRREKEQASEVGGQEGSDGRRRIESPLHLDDLLTLSSEGVAMGTGTGEDADEDPSLSTDTTPTPPLPTSDGGTAMYPAAPSFHHFPDTSASQSSFSDAAPRLAAATPAAPLAHHQHSHPHPHHHHPHPHHPSHPSEHRPIVSSSRLHEYLSRQAATSHANSLSQALSTSAPSSRRNKGKAPAHSSDDSSSNDDIIPRVHFVPVVHPDDSPYYPDSGEGEAAGPAPPIKIRRVGALGISVSSDQDDDAPAINSEGSTPRWSSTDDEQLASATPGGITDAHFRGIVDDLSLQNQALKGRLRRYEAPRVPAQLKKERLFEVRFFDGMPSEKREEIEGFLTRYVQGLAELPSLPSAAPTQTATPTPSPPLPLPTSVKPTRESPRSSRRRHHHRSTISIPSHPATAADSSTGSSDDQKAWAGPSFSGVEPTSFTGTGTGMRISASGMERRQVAPGGASLETRGDHKSAVEIVDVLERFFEGALTQPISNVDPSGSTAGVGNGTNEAYLSHLLDNASLAAGGWTYLNLVNTMSQVHRFNVTLPFVQTALRTYSTKLEVSADGAKVRWVGAKPVARPPIASSRRNHSLSSATPSVHSEVHSTSGSSDTIPSSGGGLALDNHASTIATSIQSKPTTTTTHPSHRIRPAPTAIQPIPSHVLGTLATPALSTASKVASYIPFFKGSQHDSSDDATPSSGGSGSRSGGNFSVDGTGTMVFYSNGNFCSDLSTDVFGLAETAEPTLVALGESRRPAFERDDGPSLFSSRDQPTIEEGSSSDADDCPMEFVGEEPQDDVEVEEQVAFEPSLLHVSGMTEVVPADCFTINVKTARTAPAPSSAPTPARTSRKRSADDGGGDRKRTRIVSTSMRQYDSVVPTRSTALDPEGRSARVESYTSPVHAHQPSIRSPPPPDYLLSLSLPLYAWAPRQTGLLTHREGDSAQPSSSSDSRSDENLSCVA
ncbi:hypothetical protein RQP46_005739 [Phenoliferia psychrophenolica]